LLNNFTLSGVQLSLFRSTYLESLAVLPNYYIRFLKTARMQFITAISAAAVMAATVSARSAVTLGKSCDFSKPHTKVINRCPYKVNLWSVWKNEGSNTGCPVDAMVTLQPGDTYSENYQESHGSSAGVSIKLSKTEDCPEQGHTQLEYFISTIGPAVDNYLDVSYVNCRSLNASCPTRQEGFFLAAGTAKVRAEQASNPNWCPAMSCWDSCSCGEIAYVEPTDERTKTCQSAQNMEFYMCGTEADADPDTDYSMSPVARIVNGVTDERMNRTCTTESGSSSTAPATTLQQQTSAAPKPTETQTNESYGAKAKVDALEDKVNALDVKVDSDVPAPAVTTAPTAEQAKGQLKTKTEVVYVTAYQTAYQTVNVKRHAHSHARRHAANNA
jgi:hypothetical protein